MAILNFDALAEQGQTVIYTETSGRDNSPGDGWEYWSDRATPEESVAVWRRIVTHDEAAEWEAELH